MWYNITLQLHQKVDQLGHILIGKLNVFCHKPVFSKFYFSPGLGAKLKSDVPWPNFNCVNGMSNNDEGLGTIDSVNQSVAEEILPTPSRDVSDNKLLGTQAKVCYITLKLRHTYNYLQM